MINRYIKMQDHNHKIIINIIINNLKGNNLNK